MLPIILAVLVVLVLGFGLVEYGMHQRNLAAIPIRIHVNGTRGKSSVTRLVAAGLRAGGLNTFAKTTGTLPRMIMNDGREYPVFRPAKANIIEQLRIVSLAARNRADALVIECMALQPVLQSLAELKLVRATHGVITNARADHLDVMGPEEKDVADALLGTTPVGTRLFTAERDYLPAFQAACADRGSELVAVDAAQVAAITEADLAGFSYVEHAENLALALTICQAAGVERAVALSGMWAAPPDPGVMKEFFLDFFGRQVAFVNGFAANDPESSQLIWEMTLDRHPECKRSIMVLNCRADRPDRSKQLGEVLASWRPADHYVLVGSGTYVMHRAAVDSGLDPTRLVIAENLAAEAVFEQLMGLAGHTTLVMGIGNIGGVGLDLVSYFRNRAVLSSQGGE